MQFSNRQVDAVLAGLRMLQASIGNGSVRPDDGHFGDLLTNWGAHDGVTAEEIESLVVLINEGGSDAVTVNLSIYDDERNVVDGATLDLTINQVSDIVDRAGQLILDHRAACDIGQGLAELEEACVAGGVIGD